MGFSKNPLLSPVHTGDKVHCCRNRRQIGNKVDSRQYGRLVVCVYGAKATVDRVEFNLVASVYRALDP